MTVTPAQRILASAVILLSLPIGAYALAGQRDDDRVMQDVMFADHGNRLFEQPLDPRAEVILTDLRRAESIPPAALRTMREPARPYMKPVGFRAPADAPVEGREWWEAPLIRVDRARITAEHYADTGLVRGGYATELDADGGRRAFLLAFLDEGAGAPSEGDFVIRSGMDEPGLTLREVVALDSGRIWLEADLVDERTGEIRERGVLVTAEVSFVAK